MARPAAAGRVAFLDVLRKIFDGAAGAVAVMLVDAAGNPAGIDAHAATATRSSVATDAASRVVKAANANRVALVLYNASTSANVYYVFGAVACTTAAGGYTDMIPPGEARIIDGGTWSGEVRMISDAVDGAGYLEVTETSP